MQSTVCIYPFFAPHGPLLSLLWLPAGTEGLQQCSRIFDHRHFSWRCSNPTPCRLRAWFPYWLLSKDALQLLLAPLKGWRRWKNLEGGWRWEIRLFQFPFIILYPHHFLSSSWWVLNSACNPCWKCCQALEKLIWKQSARKGMGFGVGPFLGQAAAFVAGFTQDSYWCWASLGRPGLCLHSNPLGGVSYFSSKPWFPEHYHELNVFLLWLQMFNFLFLKKSTWIK